MIHIYTGCGKGKTTAALGQAFRALGHGKRVFLVQFMKCNNDCGELKAAQRFSAFKIVQSGSNGWVKKGRVGLSANRKKAQKGWLSAQKAIAGNKYDLIILDELNVALSYKLLKLSDIKNTLSDVPDNLEVVITGRDAHPDIIKLADLVSEIKEVKHYFRKGVQCRKGIEY